MKTKASCVVVSGASGMVGQALVASLTAQGRTVRTLVRREPRAPGEHRWAPERGEIDAAAFAGADAVVHLAGENIAAGRWTGARKRRIRESRTGPTSLVARAAAKAGARVLVSASAVGIYGDRRDTVLDESSSLGEGFLSDVCREWEAAAHEADAAGVRVVTPRFGIILSQGGGALERMLLPFRMGAGGVLGPGTQWMSWIALQDAVRLVAHALSDETLSGAVNGVGPEPVRNVELTRALGRVLHRPTVVPAPAFALRLAFGEMADAILLSSLRVVPTRLQQAGFTFDFPTLDAALAQALREG